MPSETPKQHRFMEAAAHDKGFAKKAGIPQKVAKEFVTADKGKSYGKSKQGPESKRSQSALNQRLGVLPRKHGSRG